MMTSPTTGCSRAGVAAGTPTTLVMMMMLLMLLLLLHSRHVDSRHSRAAASAAASARCASSGRSRFRFREFDDQFLGCPSILVLFMQCLYRSQRRLARGHFHESTPFTR